MLCFPNFLNRTAAMGFEARRMNLLTESINAIADVESPQVSGLEGITAYSIASPMRHAARASDINSTGVEMFKFRNFTLIDSLLLRVIYMITAKIALILMITPRVTCTFMDVSAIMFFVILGVCNV